MAALFYRKPALDYLSLAPFTIIAGPKNCVLLLILADNFETVCITKNGK